MKLKDLTGQTFGELTVLKRAENHVAKNRSYVKWKCECSCGVIKDILSANLLKLNYQSCGCIKNKKASDRLKKRPREKMKEGEASFNILYNRYKKAAKDRNREFKLTKREFSILTKADCYYCGVEPSQVIEGKRTNGSYIYNGIDREDNNEGYEYWNCVTCCKTCNYAKKDLDQEDFLAWIKKVFDFNKDLY